MQTDLSGEFFGMDAFQLWFWHVAFVAESQAGIVWLLSTNKVWRWRKNSQATGAATALCLDDERSGVY